MSSTSGGWISRRDLFAQHLDRVVRADAHIREVVSGGQQEQVPDARAMDLDTEIVAPGMGTGERCQVFAVAESDLERARCGASE
jgi:hypothetical protein